MGIMLIGGKGGLELESGGAFIGRRDRYIVHLMEGTTSRSDVSIVPFTAVVVFVGRERWLKLE